MSKKQSITRDTLKQFWQFTRPDKRWFFLSVAGSAIAILVGEVTAPLVISRAFNRLQLLYSQGQPLYFDEFKGYILTYIGLMVLAFVLWRSQVVAAWVFEIRSLQRIAEKIFDHLQNMSAKFHADRFGGALVSQTNKYLGGYERVMDEFIWSITTGVVGFIASVIVLYFVNALYATALLVIFIILFSIMYRRTRIQMPLDRATASSESHRTARIADTITNVSTVRAFAGENIEKTMFHKQATETSNAHWRLLRYAWKSDVIAHFGTINISIMAFVLGVVGATVLHKPVGSLFLSVTYTIVVTRRLWESQRVMRNLNRAFGDATDMTMILQIQPDVKDLDKPEVLALKSGKVSFDNVTFSYKDDNAKPVFTNLSFNIDGGEKVGLVGPSGGGKTTITSLLLRIVDIQKGVISIDKQDIAKIAQQDLRAHIAYVPQDPLMFHRSIADNIRYGKPGASMAQVEAVAKLAHAHEFVSELPEGYDTLVGERGVKLSGGQRQRIAIARAMLKDAPIIVLDEATSALDSGSEKLIQDALSKLMEGRTTLVIAHRLSTIQHMDRIIVLDKGKIVEQGKHHELRDKKGLYAKLWAHQSGGFLEE